MTTSSTLRRLGALERSMTRGGTSSLLMLFEPLGAEDRAKAEAARARGGQVLVVRFVLPQPLISTE